jgi:beta-glucosidase
MDSYNLTNGEHLSQDSYLNKEVAKKEWGFNGIIMSDWASTYDAVAAANGGLDLEMPSGEFLNRKYLLPAIEQGKVSVATIDDKVRRILRVTAQFGWLDHNQADRSIPRYNQQGRQTALQAARESMVLLKNEGQLLPLSKSKIKSVAVIGPDAYPAVPVGGGSARVEPFASVSFLEGLSNHLGTSVPVYFSHGIPTLDEMAKATKFSTAATNGSPGLHAEYYESPDRSSCAPSPMSILVDRRVGFFLRTRSQTDGKVTTFPNVRACTTCSLNQREKMVAIIAST